MGGIGKVIELLVAALRPGLSRRNEVTPRRCREARQELSPEFIVVAGGKGTGTVYTNYQRFFGRAVTRDNFYNKGLSKAAVASFK